MDGRDVFVRATPPLEEGWLRDSQQADAQTGWSEMVGISKMRIGMFGMPDHPGLRPPLLKRRGHTPEYFASALTKKT